MQEVYHTGRKLKREGKIDKIFSRRGRVFIKVLPQDKKTEVCQIEDYKALNLLSNRKESETCVLTQ